MERITFESAQRAVKDAAWANGIGVAHGAALTVTLATDVPLALKALTFAGFLIAGANGARRGAQERRAMEEYPGIEIHRSQP